MAGSLEEAKTAYDKGDFRRAECIYSELSNQREPAEPQQLTQSCVLPQQALPE
jgi:hypothetical protein